MSRKRKSPANIAAAREETERDIKRYRKLIERALKKEPLSQTALFIALARYDRRPNPETRGHPSLMPPSAARALRSLQKEREVSSRKESRALMFSLGSKATLSSREEKIEKVKRPKKLRSMEPSDSPFSRRVVALEKSCADLRARLEDLQRWKENFEERRMAYLRRFEESLAEIKDSAADGHGVPS